VTLCGREVVTERARLGKEGCGKKSRTIAVFMGRLLLLRVRANRVRGVTPPNVSDPFGKGTGRQAANSDTLRREEISLNDLFYSESGQTMCLVIFKGQHEEYALGEWCVSRTDGKTVMFDSESSRVAAGYEANKALFLLLLSAPYRSQISARLAYAFHPIISVAAASEVVRYFCGRVLSVVTPTVH